MFFFFGWRCLRCDWETILVRLRPRESTWLDTLVAADSGCLVRTRPDGQGERERGGGQCDEVEGKMTGEDAKLAD